MKVSKRRPYERILKTVKVGPWEVSYHATKGWRRRYA